MFVVSVALRADTIPPRYVPIATYFSICLEHNAVPRFRELVPCTLFHAHVLGSTYMSSFALFMHELSAKTE